MSIKIAHLADIHIRGYSRHEEYKKVFLQFNEEAAKKKVDYIFLGGDLWHTKTSGITPEYIEFFTWWLNSMAEIAPVLVILGNHDGNLQNASRQDAVSPIIAAMQNPQIRLFKQSGVYMLEPGYNLCVFSLFDEEGWESIRPVPGDFNIACYHGPVAGCSMENGQQMFDGIPVGFFNEYDLTLLGDIHQMQYLDFREYEIEIDESELVNYPYAEIVSRN